MKPIDFALHRPDTTAGAVALLTEYGEDAKALAGGQSLLPLLNFRLARPEHVIDLGRVAGLAEVRRTPDALVIGAMVRQARAERSPEVAAAAPLLAAALPYIAHPPIRNRGTIGGSLAHADPAAELPAVLALLGGTVELASASGSRTVAAAEFFTGPLETTARPDELAVDAYFPAAPERSGCAFEEVAQRQGDYALAGVAVLVRLDDELRVESVRAAYVGLGSPPPVLDLTELAAGPVRDDRLRAYVAERIEPETDIHATAEYRRHLAGVLTDRALRVAYADAREAR